MSEIVRQTPVVATERPQEDDTPKVGEWYWVNSESDGRWLGCIIHVGTNLIEIDRAIGNGLYIHFDEFHEMCERELDPDPLIEREVMRHRTEANRLMGEVQELTRLLGVPVDRALPSPESEAITLHQTGATDAYKKALVKAKEKTLPELFKKIEEENKSMGAWMKVKLLPLQAEAKKLKRSISVIESRIFSVELYAGLTEEVKQITDGKPAAIAEKIRLHQRQHYMDEECLAQYETGGMDYKNLSDFDKWLARKDNRDRILPHPRCIVAFRIRRNRKDREVVSLHDFFRIDQEEKWDESTFLYIRNGEQLYRLETKIVFEEKLFPDTDRQVLDRGELWAKISGPAFDVDDLITDAEYQGMLEDERKARQEYKRKLRETPKKEHWWQHEPDEESKRYKRFSPDTICFDKIAEHVAKVAAAHNRIALVLQGLLDRSPVLHPHPAWKIWTRDGFERALELIYDDSRALTDGERPDFEAYRTRLNSSLKDGSITIGQDDMWARREADRDRNTYRRGRTDSERYRTHYRPYGNPGPGNLARVVKFSKRKKSALFIWERERLTQRRWSNDPKTYRCTIDVPVEKLFNVSAYTPGDFKIFFSDPRTRADYLKWAPLLLEAEEYHAGNRKISSE